MKQQHLVIDHKMRTIAEIDNVIVLEGGKVDEQGSHKELINNDGLYNKLWTL